MAAVKAKVDAVEDVLIDTGRFKYVLIKVYGEGGGETLEKYIVRGFASAEWHADIYDDTWQRLEGLGLETECVGGGRILHEPNKKSITVYGYSQGFGKADHSITAELLKKKYPDYTSITWNDEGY